MGKRDFGIPFAVLLGYTVVAAAKLFVAGDGKLRAGNSHYAVGNVCCISCLQQPALTIDLEFMEHPTAAASADSDSDEKGSSARSKSWQG